MPLDIRFVMCVGAEEHQANWFDYFGLILLKMRSVMCAGTEEHQTNCFGHFGLGVQE